MRSLTTLLLLPCLISALPQSSVSSPSNEIIVSDTNNPVVRAAQQTFGAADPNDPGDPNSKIPHWLWSKFVMGPPSDTHTWTPETILEFLDHANKTLYSDRAGASQWAPVPGQKWKYESNDKMLRFWVESFNLSARPLVWYDVVCTMGFYRSSVQDAHVAQEQNWPSKTFYYAVDRYFQRPEAIGGIQWTGDTVGTVEPANAS